MKSIQSPTLLKNEVFALKLKLKNNETKITDMLKDFIFEDKCSHQENTARLVNQLEQKIFGKGNLLGLKLYISHDYNVPIQINFKPLIFSQLKQLFDQWLAITQQQSSAPIQRMYTVNFRNPLLKRIIFQEKQTIDEYFTSLSKTKNPTQLKGFDLYQLVVSMLSPYYLYEYNEDLQVFFDKMNAFDSFMKIVNDFINHDRRIPVCDPNTLQVPRINQFIKRFEFEKLIQFWQQVNGELSIYEEQRCNKTSIQIQTTLISSLQASTQTQKSTVLNPINLINNVIKDINQLFQSQSNHQILESLDRIFACLRRQKIAIIANNNQRYRNSSRSKSPMIKPQHISRNDHFDHKKVHWGDTSTQFTPQTPPPIKKFRLQQQFNANQTLKNTFTRSKSKINQQKSPLRTKSTNETNQISNLNQIYDLYCEQNDYLNLQQLNNFFLDIGLIEQGQTHLIFNILQNNLIRDGESVTRQQFFNILKILGREQKKLTAYFIQRFLQKVRQQGRSYQKDLIKIVAPKYKLTLSQQHRIRQTKPNFNLLSGSQYGKDLSLNSQETRNKIKSREKKLTERQSQQVSLQIIKPNRTSRNRIFRNQDELIVGQHPDKYYYRQILPPRQQFQKYN